MKRERVCTKVSWEQVQRQKARLEMEILQKLKITGELCRLKQG